MSCVCVSVSVRPYVTLFKRTLKMSSSSILKSPGGVLGQGSKQAGRQEGRQASRQASRQIILRHSDSTIALRRRAGFGRWNIICTQAPVHWQVLMETCKFTFLNYSQTNSYSHIKPRLITVIVYWKFS